jgi:3,4-dihydroxy 2-butanone 4-phosphate synthase/GTP cyclohydrolase II
MLFEFDKVELAIEDIKQGKIVIVFDDVARENEGDFIAAADCITPEIINFMAKFGRGLICTAITEERAQELKLDRMVLNNTATMATAFTVSVDLLAGCTTGISASDRSKTVKALVDKNTKPEDLGRPGHIFPLIADSNGVLGRMGHTEASVDLPLLAGFNPCGVLVEIMNDDGTMARYNDLLLIAREHSLKLISITQLVEYRKTQNKSNYASKSETRKNS